MKYYFDMQINLDSTVMVKSLHTLKNNIPVGIMAVLSSNDFYNSYLSVREWVEHKPLCHKSGEVKWRLVQYLIHLRFSKYVTKYRIKFLTTPLDRIAEVGFLAQFTFSQLGSIQDFGKAIPKPQF